MDKRITSLSPPYLSRGVRPGQMMLWVLVALFLLAGVYSIVYDPHFLFRFISCLVIGSAIEAVYFLLRDGRLHKPQLSTLVTSALLVLSVPFQMPLMHLAYGLIAAIVFAKVSLAEDSIKLNPMLIGRLFLMLAYNQDIVAYSRRGLVVDAVSAATPLELFHTEGVIYNLIHLVRGNIAGSWEGLYRLVPGSPGEIFTPLIITLGIILCLAGVLNWRVGSVFLFSFAGTCFFLGEPVVFNILSGAVIFSAVFIAGDPKTTPCTKSGRLLAGLIAGILNAVIRKYTFYSEGIVFSFLLMNLLTPTLDRLAFNLRGRYLIHQSRVQKKLLR